MGTDPDIGGSRTQTKRNYHTRNHNFAGHLPKNRGTPGNPHWFTHTVLHNGDKYHRYSRIAPGNGHTLQTCRHAEKLYSHFQPNTGHKSRKEQQKPQNDKDTADTNNTSPQTSSQTDTGSTKQNPEDPTIQEKSQHISATATDKGNPDTEKINPHPHTDKVHKNPHLVHTNTEANKQERPGKSTSRQPRGAPIIDTSPESRSTENSGPEITILEQEETCKSPHAHPSNTQITIIG